jgi:hypothetical protein
MTKIIVHHHTGLGDHFICNGLVHALTDHYDIDLICKKHYTKTVEHLYEDFPNITIIPVENEMEDCLKHAQQTSHALMRVGFENCDYDNFEESFYITSGINPNDEYDRFVLPTRLDGSLELYNKITSKLGTDYIFMHNASSYGSFDLKIDSNYPCHAAVKEDTDDVLDYVDTICNAKEVHVINSGINNLVFQLFYKDKIKGKVFYHNARKPNMGGIVVKVPDGIEVVEYE